MCNQLKLLPKTRKESLQNAQKQRKTDAALMPSKIDHPQAEELNAISCILDRNPIIYDLAMQDLSFASKKSKAGAKGMTAEQIVRAAIVKQMFEFSYKDLAFHLIDSVSLRRFCFIASISVLFLFFILL